MTERPWLTNYPNGVPANIDVDLYPSLNAMLDETFVKFAHLPAFTCMDVTLYFNQIDTLSKQFAAYLHSRGLEPGDRIALMMPNILQYPIALFGALRAGLVVVNTNPLYTPREMKHQFIDSGAKAIVILENFAANLESILPETNIKTVILCSIGEMLGAVKGTIVNFVVRRIKRMVPKYQLHNTVWFKEALRGGQHFTIKPFTSSPDDTIILQYTGGTTGVSKGAMLTNRNMVANMLQCRAILSPFLNEGKEIIMCALPLYHIFAFTINCLALMGLGCHNILITNARDIPALIKEWKKYPISLFPGVNTLFNALINHPSFPTINFKDLKIAVGGGMAVQRPVAEKWKEITCVNLAEGYGMTESSPVASCNPFDDRVQIGTIGMPVPSTDMRIVDTDNRQLGINEIGEIQVKGPQVMKGYFQRDDETAKVIKDGWLSTGDIGLMRPDGYFQIVDRKKDMILVSGFNVYPNEIEEVLAMHPKVLESAAIGVHDEKSTEAVKIFVVKKDASLTAEELIEHCRKNLTGYKVPKHVEWRETLPKTNVGKILRRLLKEEEEKKIK